MNGRTPHRRGLVLLAASLALVLAATGLPVIRSAAAQDEDRGYDVTHYDLAIEVQDSTLAGTVTVWGQALEAGLDEIVLDLYAPLTVTEISSTTHTVADSSHADDFLTITLAEPLALDESFALSIGYAGEPAVVDDDRKAFTFTSHSVEGSDERVPVIFSISAPDRSGAWWPCKDVLADKATIDVTVTVADTLYAVSNGGLDSVVALGDGRETYSWSHGYPIAPYLVSLAISDYVVIEDSVIVSSGGTPPTEVTIPLYYYVYPEDEENARIDFECVKEGIVLYTDLFGDYPFPDEKCAVASIEWGGGMEHQTCTSLGSRFISGTRRYDWIFVHELAHQWWGDWVGLADWRDVWLNEGFATYSEGLWLEHTEGAEGYADFISDLDPFPPPDGPGFRGALYDPMPLFGVTPYDKGAFLLHMLRHIVGDTHFFTILTTYRERHGGDDTVETADFQAVCEEISGLDLDTFFTQWVYVEGRPSYGWQWGYRPVSTGYELTLRIVQSQAHYEVYEMPVDIRVTTASGTQTFVVQNTEREQVFDLALSERPLDVAFDPDNCILKSAASGRMRTRILSAAQPNPFRVATQLSFSVPTEGRVTIDLFDVTGRRIRRLLDDVRGGDHTIAWDGRDDRDALVESGVYWARIDVPSGSGETRIVYVR
ncbi:MAG: hypothetical protein KAY32_07090 [Candidatus Eisenbacteria sp.]|nr:hypothetical protein [Candidatus Eisenbacteria bacterium]